MSDWVRVASASEIKPGDLKVVEIDDEPVLIANTGDELLAVSDICSHEYVLMHDGWLEGSTIECPQHGSKFDLRTGAVLNLPATQPIEAYEVKVEGDDVYLRGPMERAK